MPHSDDACISSFEKSGEAFYRRGIFAWLGRATGLQYPSRRHLLSLWNLPGVPGRVAATRPGYQLLDSLAVEESGLVCVAMMVTGGITIFAEEGVQEHVEIDDPQVTNLRFAGADWRTVWITAAGTGRILRGSGPRPGLVLDFVSC